MHKISVMKIHKKTSIPREHHSAKDISCDVLIWNGEYYTMAYHNYLAKEWYHSHTLEPIEEDFVWIYPPINKMKEVFNRIIEK